MGRFCIPMYVVIGFFPFFSCSGGDSSSPVAPKEPEKLPFLELGSFPYEERMVLPDEVMRWKDREVVVTGFMNPMNQTRDIGQFLLVKDRASCCFGKLPQMNHFIDMTLREGEVIHYTKEPVPIKGTLQIGEVWEEDWLVAVYRMEDGEVVR